MARIPPLIFAAAAALAAAALLLAAPASAQPRFDFGDAPDGVSTQYVTTPQPPPVAGFPSLLASNGPRHASVGARLGLGADRERDSRQVDRDRFDDGASFDRLAPCARSRLTVMVNLRNMPRRVLRRAARRNQKLFVNGWADWNRDGDWNDTLDCPEGTADEWFAHNVAVPVRRVVGGARPRSWKPRSRWVVPVQIRFRGGPQVTEFWWRVTLTLGERVTQRGGVTPKPYRFGETEDYWHLGKRIPPPPEDDNGDGDGRRTSPFAVGCGYSPLFHDPKSPPLIVMPHGQRLRVPFWLHNDNPAAPAPPPRWRLIRVNKRKIGDRPPKRTFRARHIFGRMIPAGQPVRGFAIRSTRQHRTSNPLEFHRLAFAFRRPTNDPPPRFWRARAVCRILIVHAAPLGRGAGAAPPPAPDGVQGHGFFEPDGLDPGVVHFGFEFDRDVDGFVIRLRGAPLRRIVNIDIAGLDCEIAPDGRSVRCVGRIPDNVQIVDHLELDAAPGADLGLELWALENGDEKGPFELESTSQPPTGEVR